MYSPFKGKFVNWCREGTVDHFSFPNLPYKFDGFRVSDDFKKEEGYGKILAMALDNLFLQLEERKNVS